MPYTERGIVKALVDATARCCTAPSCRARCSSSILNRLRPRAHSTMSPSRDKNRTIRFTVASAYPIATATV